MPVSEFAAVDDLPGAALALLDGDFFSTASWYRTVIAHGIAAGTRAVLLVFADAAGTAAVFPMQVTGRRAASLTNPYTCRWRPLLAQGLDPARREAVFRAFSAWCRRFSAVRLEALDAADAAVLSAAVHGMARLRFDNFGNWCFASGHFGSGHCGSGHFGSGQGAAEQGWPSYFAARPGHVREAVRRRSKKLLAAGAAFRIIMQPGDIDTGIAAYENVYANSWKIAEPFPSFNAALMRSCAAAGTLRLGLLTQGGQVLAAQFWVVRGSWAAVLKLAHDEAAKAYSPGTVLTAFMIESLLSRDGVTELDFGRGDDAYKQSWAGGRRQREGLVLANYRTPSGAAMIVRHFAGRVIRRQEKPGGPRIGAQS
jgi:hypothetical protein